MLLIGEGNGRFLARCLKEKVSGTITIIDSSRKMLARARARALTIPHRVSLQFVHGDIRELPHEFEPFDGIVTHFFLDLFRPDSQSQVIRAITRLAASHALWINVDYVPRLPTGFRRAIDWLQYRFDQNLCGVEADRHYDPTERIIEHGWTPSASRDFLSGAVKAQLLERTRSTER